MLRGSEEAETLWKTLEVGQPRVGVKDTEENRDRVSGGRRSSRLRTVGSLLVVGIRRLVAQGGKWGSGTG